MYISHIASVTCIINISLICFYVLGNIISDAKMGFCEFIDHLSGKVFACSTSSDLEADLKGR